MQQRYQPSILPPFNGIIPPRVFHPLSLSPPFFSRSISTRRTKEETKRGGERRRERPLRPSTLTPAQAKPGIMSLRGEVGARGVGGAEVDSDLEEDFEEGEEEPRPPPNPRSSSSNRFGWTSATSASVSTSAASSSAAAVVGRRVVVVRGAAAAATGEFS